MASYYFFEAGRTQGPVPAAELVKRAGFHGGLPVAPAGATSAHDWRAAKDVPELAEAYGGPLPPPPPPSELGGGRRPGSLGGQGELTIGLPPGSSLAEPAKPADDDPASKTVLVVDDDPMTRELLLSALAPERFQTLSADNGAAALDVLKRRMPDLIITDLVMPEKGGFELLRSLRAESPSQVPILIVTAKRLDLSTIQMITSEGNVIEFFQKPFLIERLLATVHEALKTTPRRGR